jgi:hypothetical protein
MQSGLQEDAGWLRIATPLVEALLEVIDAARAICRLASRRWGQGAGPRSSMS